MKYSYEFKIEAIELYKKGRWIDPPGSCHNPEHFHNEIRKWNKIYDSCGPEALRHKTQNKEWTAEEKLELVSKVLAGQSCRLAALEAGINDGQLYQWVRKYKLYGYNGLVDMKKGRKPKVPDMSKKKDNIPQELTVSEKEELIRLRAEVEYYKTENEAIKKEIASRHARWDAQLEAKKQRSSRNSKTKGMN